MTECNGGEKHCDHPTGSGTSHGWGGGDYFICCMCGFSTMKRWSIQERPLPGHGPHFRQRLKVYDDAPAIGQTIQTLRDKGKES